MNRKAIELAITTLILIILGILVLVGLIYMTTNGFNIFKATTKPFLDTAQSTAIKLACSQACENQDKLVFCCNEYEIDNEKISCKDSRLEINCGLDCGGFSCGGVGQTFIVEYTYSGWPDIYGKIILENKKATFEEQIEGELITKNINLRGNEWEEIISIFAERGVIELKQENLQRPQNFMADAGSSILKINSGNEQTILYVGVNDIVNPPSNLDVALKKLDELINRAKQ